MSIIVRINNKDANWIKMDRACFGFLSYIDQWDEDDVEDHCGCNPLGYNGLPGFSPDNLDSVDYIESCDSPEYLDQIRAAMAGLPQYYGDISINDSRMKRDWEVEFNIPLAEAKCMQVPVIAGMMLRNVLNYHNYKRTFNELIKGGVEAPMAFVLSQIYPFRQNALDKNLEGFYRAFGGDETIFPAEARLCDIVHMLKGELGDAWQGPFGETSNGYGRYGEYDGEDAEESDRTGHAKALADVTLVQDREVYKDSPSLNSVMFEGCGVLEPTGRVFIKREDFINKLIPHIQELLK